jgi:hypothetical protein
MREEVKARLEASYLKKENEARNAVFSKVKEMNTVELEKYKIAA